MIEELQRIIDNLNYQISSLSSSIKSYNSLNAQLAGIVSSLKSESEKLDNFSNKVGNYYTVDELLINGKILDCKDNVDSVISYINGITSGINSKISDINSKIEKNKNSIWYYEKKLKEEKGE